MQSLLQKCNSFFCLFCCPSRLTLTQIIPAAQRSAGLTRVHHVEWYLWISPELLGRSKKPACKAGLWSFFSNIGINTPLSTLGEKYPSNQPRLGKITTVKLARSAFPPWDTGITSLGYCFLPGSACWGWDLYRWPHSLSVWEAPLIAIGLQITLTMVRKNPPGLARQAPLHPLTLLYSRHIKTWLLKQRVGLTVSTLQQTQLKKMEWRQKKSSVPTTTVCVNESSSGQLQSKD